jgi:hypothetical protein
MENTIDNAKKYLASLPACNIYEKMVGYANAVNRPTAEPVYIKENRSRPVKLKSRMI